MRQSNCRRSADKRKKQDNISSQKAKVVSFRLYAPEAKDVLVVGSFNDWDPAQAIAAKRDSQGNWIAKKKLTCGRYEYKFIVDGNWLPDPNCPSQVQNPFGSQNSLLEVK